MWLAALGSAAFAAQPAAEQSIGESSSVAGSTGEGVQAEAPLKEEASKEPPTLLVLGDSLSAAYALAPEQGWVSLVEAQINADRPRVNIVNASISGLTLAGGLQILANLLDTHDPDYFILALGANDGLQGRSFAHIRNGLTEILAQAQAQGATAMLLGVRLPPNRGRRYTEPFFNLYAEVAQQQGTAYVPFFLQGVAGFGQYMQADGLHPNAAGQAKIADNLLAEIEALIEK